MRDVHAVLAIICLLELGIRVGLELPRPWLPALGNPKAFIQENFIHVLQAAPRGLRVEEVGDGDESGIEHGPDDVQFGTEVFDGVRGEKDNGEVGEPVGADTNGDTFVAGSKRHDFRSVHPGDGQDPPGEDVKEEEAKGYKDPLGLYRCQ